MVYSQLTDYSKQMIFVALTGAKGNFGRTFMAQLRCLPNMRARILVDLDPEGLSAMLTALGFTAQEWCVCHSATEVARAIEANKMALIADFNLCAPQYYEVLVEATGNCRAGFEFAQSALNQGRHVVMVSKEVESIAGVYLSRLATAKGVNYIPGLGDQPANLLELLDWIEKLGLKVIAVGKSSEYDLIYDHATGILTQLNEQIIAPELSNLLTLSADIHTTLAARQRAVQSLKRSAAADYCEMAVVSQYSGFLPDIENFHYPVARPNELADIYALKTHGGLLEHSGITDVFSMLRLPHEASFAGGEFVIFETNDRVTWEILREKGHIVSRDGRYGCLYSPYHLLGVQTPLSVFAAVNPQYQGRIPQQCSVLAGRAACDLEEGMDLRVAGHHHEIEGVLPVLRPRTVAEARVAPFYLLDKAKIIRPVAAGSLITIDDIDDYAKELWVAFQKGSQNQEALAASSKLN